MSSGRSDILHRRLCESAYQGCAILEIITFPIQACQCIVSVFKNHSGLHAPVGVNFNSRVYTACSEGKRDCGYHQRKKP